MSWHRCRINGLFEKKQTLILSSLILPFATKNMAICRNTKYLGQWIFLEYSQRMSLLQTGHIIKHTATCGLHKTWILTVVYIIKCK